MERLFLVDQSLERLGSSNFDYLSCIAKAASDDGFEIKIGAGNRFRWKQSDLSECLKEVLQTAKVFPCFRSGNPGDVSWLAGATDFRQSAMMSDADRGVAGFRLKALFQKYKFRAFRARRRKQIAQFACDCNRFFRTAATGEFRRGDQVFFNSASEMELMGLAVFLANAPSSDLATWHLQFQQPMLGGSPAAFAAQAKIERKIRGCFLAALSRISDHDVRLYCSSHELIEQYSRLEVARFEFLPYPVNPAFAPRAKNRVAEPLKVFSDHQGDEYHHAGMGLSDRAQERDPLEPFRMIVPSELSANTDTESPLREVVANLRDDYFAGGRLQLVAPQPKKKRFGRTSPSSFPNGQQSIRDADFALMPKAERPCNEAAKLFGELLSCGKPVIVPAGSVMASQLHASQDQHIDSVRNQFSYSRTIGLSDLSYGSDNAPLSGGIISFDRQRHPFCAEAENDPSENVAIVSFRWHHADHSRSARIRCTEHRGGGQKKSTVRIAPHRKHAQRGLALFRLGFGGDKIALEIENAFDDSTATIRDLKIEFLSARNIDDVRLGSSGLTYADASSAEEAIIEMVENLEYYRRNAEAFSQAWWQSHDPRQTLAKIVGSKLSRKAA